MLERAAWQRGHAQQFGASRFSEAFALANAPRVPKGEAGPGDRRREIAAVADCMPEATERKTIPVTSALARHPPPRRPALRPRQEADHGGTCPQLADDAEQIVPRHAG